MKQEGGEKVDILDRGIDRGYPKVKPLSQMLLAAAIEQEATVKDFELASQRVLNELKEQFLCSRLADFVSDI